MLSRPRLTRLTSRSVKRGRARLVAAFFALAAATTACREPFQALASDSAGADGISPGEQLFSALGARMTEPYRDARYDKARREIANAAFLPSRVFKDTSIWTTFGSQLHSLGVAGRFANGRYELTSTPNVPHPTTLADSRHFIHLIRISDDEYAWDTDVDYAIGSAAPGDVAEFFGALASAAEGHDETRLRAAYVASAPRSSAVLSQLFRVDSVRIAALRDGSTIARYAVTITPDGLAARFPNYARYLRRYALTARMRMSLADSGGARFFEMSMRDGHIVTRMRTHSGRLAPLAGVVRPMPDTLTLHADLTVRVRSFNVGFREYRGLFVLDSSPDDRAWTLISRTEPHWVLPLITERLLRAPLRRPFQDQGSLFRVGVRSDSVSTQTLLYRKLHLEVQESLILRFIGRLGAIAVGEYTGETEKEQAAWLRQLFTAVVADIAQ